MNDRPHAVFPHATSARATILVAGNVNVETRVAVGGFPIDYEKVRYAPGGVSDRVGGVAWNVAAALARLGRRVELAAHVGEDAAGEAIRAEAGRHGIGLAGAVGGEGVATPRSVVLEAPDGRGAIVTDLKHLEARAYPGDRLATLLEGARHVHATNIGWALEVARAARAAGATVSTDVQAIASPDEAYAAAFVEAADIVLFSAERLGPNESDAVAGARRVLEAWRATWPGRWFVAGCGAAGALIAGPEGGAIEALPTQAVGVRAGATGAGDTLAAGVVDGVLRGLAPRDVLERAQRFVAAYLRGDAGPARWIAGCDLDAPRS